MVWTDEQQRRYDEYMAYLDARDPDDMLDGCEPDEPDEAPVLRANSVRLTRLDAIGNPIPGTERNLTGHIHFTLQQSDQVDSMQRAVRAMQGRLAPLAQAAQRLGQVRASRGTHDGGRR